MDTDGCYVILTNYNGDTDTIECLESLLHVTTIDLRIVVVDNSQTLSSLAKIQDWAEGKIKAGYSDNPVLKSLVYPYTAKPISTTYVDGDADISDVDSQIILTHMPENRGFAAAMNWGIRLAQREGRYAYYWILNNDTVVDGEAARLMIEKCKSDKRIGICGCRQYIYDTPDKRQKEDYGFNKWFCRDTVIPEDSPQNKIMKYSGSSFMVTSNFLDTVGLMCEDYFLYYEEHDWVLRARKKGFIIVQENNAVVYHKGGKATGEYGADIPSYLSDYYGHRSRILFTLKFYPYCLPTLYLSYLAVILKRLWWHKYDRVWMILKLMIRLKKDRQV